MQTRRLVLASSASANRADDIRSAEASTDSLRIHWRLREQDAHLPRSCQFLRQLRPALDRQQPMFSMLLPLQQQIAPIALAQFPDNTAFIPGYPSRGSLKQKTISRRR